MRIRQRQKFIFRMIWAWIQLWQFYIPICFIHFLFSSFTSFPFFNFCVFCIQDMYVIVSNGGRILYYCRWKLNLSTTTAWFVSAGEIALSCHIFCAISMFSFFFCHLLLMCVFVFECVCSCMYLHWIHTTHNYLFDSIARGMIKDRGLTNIMICPATKTEQYSNDKRAKFQGQINNMALPLSV